MTINKMKILNKFFYNLTQFLGMAYRNKTYVCFDATNDILYYNLMKAWKANDNIDFDFYNAHDYNDVNDTDSEATIKRKLKQRLNNTKLFLVLVGEKTKNHYKYVRWEIEIALNMELPIIVVNLNKIDGIDNNLCPAILKNELAIHVPYNQKDIMLCVDNWGDKHYEFLEDGETGAKILER